MDNSESKNEEQHVRRASHISPTHRGGDGNEPADFSNNRFMTDMTAPQVRKKQVRNELRALKNYGYFIILPNDCWKLRWDLFISLLIVATAIYTPYRLAYIDVESVGWMTLEIVVDLFFLLDIIFTFFSAYYDSTDVLIDSRRRIACNYLRGWLWVDFISIFPVSLILDQTTQVNDLARVARLSRLYRLIKMIKLLRMMRIVKQRGKF